MAKTNRRYYWIQLAQDFFKSKEMKLLRKMPGGDTYTIIYLKLMLISLEDNGKIYFEELAQDLAEEMALLIDEDTEAVRMTLMFLNKKGLLTRHSDYEFFLEQVPEMIGSETASTRRSRKHREQKALQCNTNATKRNGDIEIDKEIELEKDINIESEVDKEQTTADEKSDFNIFEHYQSRIGVLDGYQMQKLKDFMELDGLEPGLIKRAIDRAADNSKRNFGYVNSILKNWAQNGIKTIVQQDEEQRKFEDNKASQNSYTQRPQQKQPKQTNVPDWWDKEYKHEATPEEQAQLEALKKSMSED
ncbi:phage replisome organizer, putative, N-terminal region [Streptococcus gallolyticus]|uniref:Phage replisome organizer, putative, N-terminal region n=1 Tax=Streptococcus gallolyticus TaxID=315405 RepID=A0A1I7JJ14_9STRE|nr:phage replisome organizer N-terminal domain-containing protein [Streptococcus gallolyticus]SFC86035.1 phage replisome organizer, putative, N-terminal region [Streptococcus gallolyticus]SFU85111.1 phage replisome organizer, putative, N-terminal region [Streptococcus gallolyticus]